MHPWFRKLLEGIQVSVPCLDEVVLSLGSHCGLFRRSSDHNRREEKLKSEAAMVKKVIES
jgi:hypothetical protein